MCVLFVCFLTSVPFGIPSVKIIAAPDSPEALSDPLYHLETVLHSAFHRWLQIQLATNYCIVYQISVVLTLNSSAEIHVNA